MSKYGEFAMLAFGFSVGFFLVCLGVAALAQFVF